MQSLDEAYDRRVGTAGGEDRLALGFGLLAAGVVLVFAGGVFAVSSTLGELLGYTVAWERWGAGALVAGVGLPLAFVGVFTAVPTPRSEKLIAGAGIAVTFLGVLLFHYAYPTRWAGDSPDLTGLVFVVYTAGAVVMFYSLFRSVLNIEISLPRNRLSLQYVEEAPAPAESQPETEKPAPAAGGVGCAVEVSGGTDAEVMDSDDGADDRAPARPFAGDRYCGNCEFYDYVQERDGASVPYCGLHEHVLRDLEACEDHEMRAAIAGRTADD